MKLSAMTAEIIPLFRSRRSLHMIGPPGCAKTAFVHLWAAILGKWLGGEVVVITVLLSQRSAQEIIGYMIPTKDEHGRAIAIYTISNIQHAIEAAYARGAKGVILFFDEFAQAQHPEQKAASECLYARKVGDYAFPATTWVLMASNRPQDGAGALKPLSHNVNRVNTQEIELDHDANTKHNMSTGMHPVFVACAAKNPGIFVDCVPGGADAGKPYCTFRSYTEAYEQWSYLSGFADSRDTAAPLRTDQFALDMFGGYVSKPAALKIFQFTTMHDLVPSIEEIRKDPAKAKLPPAERLDVHYYAMQLVAYHANDNGGRDMDNLFTYMERLRRELLTAGVQQLMSKEDTSFLLHSKKMTEWIRKNPQLVGASVTWAK